MEKELIEKMKNESKESYEAYSFGKEAYAVVACGCQLMIKKGVITGFEATQLVRKDLEWAFKDEKEPSDIGYEYNKRAIRYYLGDDDTGIKTSVVVSCDGRNYSVPSYLVSDTKAEAYANFFKYFCDEIKVDVNGNEIRIKV